MQFDRNHEIDSRSGICRIMAFNPHEGHLTPELAVMKSLPELTHWASLVNEPCELFAHPLNVHTIDVHSIIITYNNQPTNWTTAWSWLRDY
jgi:hypothetical protein